MTGPAWVGDPADPEPDNPNELLTWSCTQLGTVDNSVMGFPTKLSTLVDQDGNTAKSFVDGGGHRVGSKDQDENLTTMTYDAGGNMLTRTVTVAGTSLVTEYIFDDLGRQVEVRNPLWDVSDPNLFATKTIYYPTTGKVWKRSDSKGMFTEFVYDELDRIKETKDRMSQLTFRTYDEGGRLELLTDAEGKVTKYKYDLLGQKTKTTFAYVESTHAYDSEFTNEYDAAGRVTIMKAHSGKTKTNVFEFSGVLDKIEYRDIDGGPVVNTDDFSYDEYLRRIGSTSTDGVERALTYTERGQLETDKTTYGEQDYVVRYGYDLRGRNNNVTYPSGRGVGYSFTNRGELDTVAWNGGAAGAEQLVEDRNYDELGRLTTIDRLGAPDEERTYDAANRLLTIGDPVGGVDNVGVATYTYDANNNKLTETWTGVLAPYSFETTPGSPTWDGREPAAYDAENRLRNFIQPGVSNDIELVRNNIGVITDPKTPGSNNVRTLSDTWEPMISRPADPISYTTLTVNWKQCGPARR